MLVKTTFGGEAWTTVQPETIFQSLVDGKNGVPYRIAQFTQNDPRAADRWWQEWNTGKYGKNVKLQTALHNAIRNGTVYRFYGTAHVPVKTRAETIAPSQGGLLLDSVLALSVRQRVYSEARSASQPDLLYFEATAQLPGVFTARLIPPSEMFWKIPPQTGFIVQSHLECIVSYEFGGESQQSRYLVNARDGTFPLEPAELGKRLGLLMVRGAGILERQMNGGWSLGWNGASNTINKKWLQALSSL